MPSSIAHGLKRKYWLFLRPRNKTMLFLFVVLQLFESIDDQTWQWDKLSYSRAGRVCGKAQQHQCGGRSSPALVKRGPGKIIGFVDMFSIFTFMSLLVMVPSTSLIINLSVELKRKTEKWNKIFSSGHTYLENWNYEIQSYQYLTNFLCLEIFGKCDCCQPPTLHYSLLVSDWAPASLRGWVDCHGKNFQNWAFRSRRLSSLLAQAHCSQRHPPGNVDQHEDIGWYVDVDYLLADPRGEHWVELPYLAVPRRWGQRAIRTENMFIASKVDLSFGQG